jgi:hypothetical protein
LFDLVGIRPADARWTAPPPLVCAGQPLLARGLSAADVAAVPIRKT